MRFILVALLLLAGDAWCATWYVDQAGTGAGAADGTSYANRFAGWNDAWTTAADIDAGDTVYACGTQTGTMAFSDGGSVGNRLTIDGACPKGDGTLDQGIVNANGATCWTSLTTRTYITVQNMQFYGFTGTCLDMRTSTADWVLNTSFTGVNNGSETALIIGNASVIVRNVDILRASSGIATRGCTNCVFDDIEIRDGGALGTGSTANLDGFGLDDSAGVGCEGTTVTDVRVYNQGSTQGSGIDFQCSAGTGAITASKLYVTGGEGVGITVGSLATLANNISSSISWGNDLNQWYQKTTNTPATYSNIIGVAKPGSAQSAFRFGDGSSSTMTATIRNSIFQADTQTLSRNTTSGTLTDSFNDYFGPLHDTTNGTRTLAQWLSDGQCAAGGCQAVDPQFVGGANPTTAEGFRLKKTSPLRGAAVCTTTDGCVAPDFADNTLDWDIGAFRRDSCYRRSRDGNMNPARTRSEVVMRCLGTPPRYPEGL